MRDVRLSPRLLLRCRTWAAAKNYAEREAQPQASSKGAGRGRVGLVVFETARIPALS